MILFTSWLGLTSTAQEISIVDVKRNITLADSDPVYKDFYLNAGESSALRKNMVITVKRKISVRDTGSKSVGDFETVVGQLKVIHIGNKVSVAREYKLLPRDAEPMLEQIGMMSGDRIDLSGAFIDNKPPVKATVQTAEAPKPFEAEQRIPAATSVEESTVVPAAPASLPFPASSTQQPVPIPQL